jgi:hypothetical protein
MSAEDRPDEEQARNSGHTKRGVAPRQYVQARIQPHTSDTFPYEIVFFGMNTLAKMHEDIYEQTMAQEYSPQTGKPKWESEDWRWQKQNWWNSGYQSQKGQKGRGKKGKQNRKGYHKNEDKHANNRYDYGPDRGGSYSTRNQAKSSNWGKGSGNGNGRGQNQDQSRPSSRGDGQNVEDEEPRTRDHAAAEAETRDSEPTEVSQTQTFVHTDDKKD